MKNKMNGLMKKLSSLRTSKQLLFSLLAVVMLLLIAGVVVNTSMFLVKHLNRALTATPAPAPAVKFDIEGFEKLQLTK